MALLRGFHDGPGATPHKAEYTYATASLGWHRFVAPRGINNRHHPPNGVLTGESIHTQLGFIFPYPPTRQTIELGNFPSGLAAVKHRKLGTHLQNFLRPDYFETGLLFIILKIRQ